MLEFREDGSLYENSKSRGKQLYGKSHEIPKIPKTPTNFHIDSSMETQLHRKTRFS